MKKRVVLLPLLALCLIGCNLNFNSNNQNSNDASSREPISSIAPEDIAIKLLNAVTIFPDLNDEIDLDEYADINPGFDYTLSDFTFTSTNNSVIKIENYHAKCIGEGYCEVKVSGPTITKEPSLSFYVGSIAGKYVAQAPLGSKFSLEIGEMNNAEERACEVNLTIKEGAKINKTDVAPFEGKATYIKDRTPFLNLAFDGDSPSSLSSIVAYLSTFGLDGEEFDIETNIYGLMAYDEDYGLEIKMMVNEWPVALYSADL